jgi:hypothetical protein
MSKSKENRHTIMLAIWFFSLLFWRIISRFIITFINWFLEASEWNIIELKYVELILIFGIWFAVFKFAMFWFDNVFYHTRIRELKEQWLAIKKKALISEFVEWYKSRNDEYYCYFIAFDWKTYYNSCTFTEQLQKPVWVFWRIASKDVNLDFNPNKLTSYEENNLKRTINKIEEEKKSLNIKIQESWKIKWFILKKEMESLEESENNLKNWEKAYIKRWKNRITLWDEVNIYLDPMNPKDYRIDIDNYLFNE